MRSSIGMPFRAGRLWVEAAESMLSRLSCRLSGRGLPPCGACQCVARTGDDGSTLRR
jgi:hypothetical protein